MSAEHKVLVEAWDHVADALQDDRMRPIRYAKCIRYLFHSLGRDARILEVGCGEGTGLVFLRAAGFQALMGVEVSSERLRRAKERTGECASLALVSPSQGLPFRSESFDAVIAAAVIEHTSDPKFFVQEIARITRPGGYVVFSSDCYSWRILQVLGIYESVQPIDRALFPTTLFRYFAVSGLKLIHCEGFPLPGLRFRFIRLIIGSFWTRVVCLLRKFFPERLRSSLRRCWASPGKSVYNRATLKAAEALQLEAWQPRHWMRSFPKLLLSDENVFFLVKNHKVNMLRVRSRGFIVSAARAIIPASARSWLETRLRRVTLWPQVGYVSFGSLRRVTPISRIFGFDRGLCIDRYYIEAFLAANAQDIHGHVLEIGDDSYTRKFGGERVAQSDVLHLRAGNPKATLVADLTKAQNIPSDTFDCIIFTQTLQFIYDVRAALIHLNRILKPGGILLATIPGISQISRHDMERWGDYWRFTTLSARRLFEEIFPKSNVTVQAYGNVLTAIAFLEGLAVKELRREELDHLDADYELLITVRAKKPEGAL